MFLIFVALPAAVFGTVIWRLVSTALGLKHLVELGPGGRIETEAMVLEKRGRIDKIRRGTRRFLLRYEYRDGTGAVHRRRSEVPEKLWKECRVNGPVLIAYSSRRPGVAAPLATLEEATARFARRPGSRTPTGAQDA